MEEKKNGNFITVYTVLEEDFPDDEVPTFNATPFMTPYEARKGMELRIDAFLEEFSTPNQEIERGESYFIWHKEPNSTDSHEIYIQESAIEVNSDFFSKIAQQEKTRPVKPFWPHTPNLEEMMNTLENLENSGRSGCTVKELLEELRRNK